MSDFQCLHFQILFSVSKNKRLQVEFLKPFCSFTQKKNGTIFDGTCAFTCIQHCDKIGLKTSVFIHSNEYSMPENMGPFSPDGSPYQSIPVLVLFKQIDQSVYSRPVPQKKGSFSYDDGDGNENDKTTIGLLSKTTTRFFVHCFAVTARLLFLFLFLFLNLSAVPKKSTQVKFAYIRHLQQIAISGTKR